MKQQNLLNYQPNIIMFGNLNFSRKIISQLLSENLKNCKQYVKQNKKNNNFTFNDYCDFVFASFIYIFDDNFKAHINRLSDKLEIKGHNDFHTKYVDVYYNNNQQTINQLYKRLSFFVSNGNREKFNLFVNELNNYIERYKLTDLKQIKEICQDDLLKFVVSYVHFVDNETAVRSYYFPIKTVYELLKYFTSQNNYNIHISSDKQNVFKRFSKIYSRLKQIDVLVGDNKVTNIEQLISDFLTNVSFSFDNDYGHYYESCSFSECWPDKLIKNITKNNKLMKKICKYSDIQYVYNIDSYNYYSSNCEYDDESWTHIEYIERMFEDKFNIEYSDGKQFNKCFDKLIKKFEKNKNEKIKETGTSFELLKVMFYSEILFLFIYCSNDLDSSSYYDRNFLNNFSNLIHAKSHLKYIRKFISGNLQI